jgi:squalene-hopene/tetraprenyl-beta-curcumene cyclase
MDDNSLSPRAEAARDAAQAYLLSIQNSDGHWCGELEGDSILESEYILTQHYIGRSASARCKKAAAHLRAQQLEEGGWAIYAGGPSDVSSTAKAYFVLKLMGDDPAAPHMERARRTVLDLGGLEACNTFTQIYLAIFGQFPWGRCPAVPPEMVLLPSWSPFNLYGISAWSRTIVVPLSIIWAHKPQCPVPEHARITELLTGRWPEDAGVRKYTQSRIWTTFFTGMDRWLKLRERVPPKPLRRMALNRCEDWMLRRLEKSDGLGAIFPPIINTIIALRCLDYSLEHPVLAGQVAELERLCIEEEDTLRVQPCLSPVWDTGIALNALLEAGVSSDHDGAQRAAKWLVDHEVRQPGDWQKRLPGIEPGGWYFEYANEWYPDCDDTSEVLTGLARMRMEDPAEERRKEDAIARGTTWLLAMQNKDGGWAAFDKDCDREVYTHVPFADHNAMLDPSCEDITSRVLESLHVLGFDATFGPAARAIRFLLGKQEPDGSWFGRWGCNYIYGTWLALWGLRAIGHDMTTPEVRRAAAWLVSVQNPDGGWGESARSYDEPALKGQGPSTAAQTAWALMGLHAAGDGDDPVAARGIEFLLRTQRADGAWYDAPWTGTGFPKVFYLRYHLYAVYFPLMALGVYTRVPEPVESQTGSTDRLKMFEP